MKNILRKFIKENFIIFFLIIASSFFTILTNFITASIINSIIQLNLSKFIKNVIEILLAYGLFLLFTYLKIVKIGSTTQKMSTYLRKQVAQQIFKSSYEEFHKKDSGMYVSWLTNDITQIEQTGFNQFYELISGIVLTLFSLISLILIHWSLFLLTIIEVLIITQIPKIFNKKIVATTTDLTNENEEFVSKTTDVISSYNTLFSFRRFNYILTKLVLSSKKLEIQKNKTTRVMALVAIAGGIGNILGQVSILTFSGYLAFIKVISIGSISASSQFASEIFNTVGNLSQYIASINGTKPIFEKFNKLTDDNLTRNNEQNLSLSNGFILKNLSYSYNTNKKVLENIDFNFELNKKYAIIGNSGSGKSTLLNILSGKLSDYEGSVTFNNIELKSINLNDLFKNIIYIDQNPYIFNGSIRENLCLDESFSDKKISAILKQVNLLEIINNLSDGLDSNIGENGRLLSGGQLQRLVLARGLLRNKNIILIDEGTSKLDSYNSKNIENLILSDPNKTVIMITHHLQNDIKNKLDHILYLN